MNIGKRIALCRKQAGLSQEQLAERLGVSRQAVSRWETGDATPDTEKVIQLSRLFHVTTDYLLLGEAAAAPPAGFEQAKENSEPAVSALPPGIRGWDTKRKWSAGLIGAGFVCVLLTLISAGAYSDGLTGWYDTYKGVSFGKFGTALFLTWRSGFFWAGIAAAVVGALIPAWRGIWRVIKLLFRDEYER